MESNYLVSVIIPVHNTAPYLHKCVESVRNQSLKEIEIILVENMSIDNSAEICDEYAKIDSRIKVIHLPIAGLCIARNAGIDAATAPYIGFVDSDDYIGTDMFKDLVEAMTENDADLTFCNYCYEYEDGHIELLAPNSGNNILCVKEELLRDLMWERKSCAVWIRLFKRELFTSLRFPEGFVYEDRRNMPRWIMMCDRIVWVDKTYYYYVERANSICHTISPENRYHYILSCFIWLDFIHEQALFSGRELVDVQTVILRNALMQFKQALQRVRPKNFKNEIDEIRKGFNHLLTFPKNEFDVRVYKRIRNIAYYWPIYYCVHFAFKELKQ